MLLLRKNHLEYVLDLADNSSCSPIRKKLVYMIVILFVEK
nr:MAG TPA: hypothetical protein [Myoviridae sp. ctfuG5]